MYRQVWVDSNGRNYQRILWRDKINEPIKTYRLCTVTYGTVPASFLSVACLQLTASSGDVPSDISQIILSDFCVDDCLTGASSIPQAINLRDGLIRHLNNNGFELDKWTSNNSNLLKNILNPNENSVYSLDMSDKVIKTLGLFWARLPIVLYTRHEHELLLHAGPQAMLANVRLTYWPINGRRTARKVAHACITCFKNKPKTLEPIMGNLPKLRVDQPMRSFENAGVDYAGPIMMKINSRRNSPLQKAYVCIFVCLATKAVHIELVCDLTTDAFIAALTRFISRRGK
ncbi:uncharacterized protein LOC111030521, partial [Myzus persicae]|uniref:uncharacterized protein LOC111030521 n=1 Tax=Myzus persicae TaxID=13164 RepID=UPI000B930BEB